MSNLPQSFIYADIQLQTSGHSPAKTQKTMQLSIKTKTKGHKFHETLYEQCYNHTVGNTGVNAKLDCDINCSELHFSS